MKNTVSLEQTEKFGNFNADLIKRQYKIYKKATFMDFRSINPKLKQSEMARELRISPSTLQRYRREINRLSPYRKPNTYTEKRISPNHDHKMTSNDLKLTSIELKMTSKDENDEAVSKKIKSKNNLKGVDPNDVNPSNEKCLIEQAFSSH